MQAEQKPSLATVQCRRSELVLVTQSDVRNSFVCACCTEHHRCVYIVTFSC